MAQRVCGHHVPSLTDPGPLHDSHVAIGMTRKFMTHSLPTTYEWIQSSSTKVSESYSGPDSVQSVSRHRHGHGMVPARSSPGPCFGYTFKWTPNLAHALVKEPETRYPVSSTTSKPALRRSSSSSLQSSSAKVSVIPRPRLSAKYATPQTWSWYVLPRVRPLGPCWFKLGPCTRKRA